MNNFKNDDFQHSIINKVLLTLCGLNIIACVAFLYVFGLTLAEIRPLIQYATTSIFIIFCWKRQLFSAKTKTLFMIVYGFAVTTAGMIYIATLSISIIILAMIPIVAALYFDKRQLYFLLLLIIINSSLIAAGYVSGHFQLQIDPHILLTKPVYWFSYILILLVALIAICNAIISYRQRLSELVATIESQNKQLTILAETDPLTELTTLRVARDRLEMTVARCHRYKKLAAVLFIDIDDFKNINDSYGHAIGDICLQVLAKRLASCIREGDTLARIGGDEFLIILEDIGDQTALEHSLDNLLKQIVKPIETSQQSLFLSCSIGAAMVAEQGNAFGQLKAKADKAMYHSKRHGKNRYSIAGDLSTEGIVAI